MKEMIEVETGFGSCQSMDAFRLYATDLVVLARALKGNEYIDVCITDGVRRIAYPEMFAGAK